MLTVKTPSSYEPERRYVLRTVLDEFLGLDCQIELSDGEEVTSIAGGGKELALTEGLFSTAERFWLKPESLPSQPLRWLDLRSLGIEATAAGDRLPLIYGRHRGEPGFLSVSGNRMELGLDIFGSIFFMLSRYEEAVKPERDAHGRFPCAASLAGQEGFLDRPVVNEYVEVLWSLMARLWPSLERRARAFKVVPSHDVDCPAYYTFYPAGRILLGMAGDLVKRRSPGLLGRKLKTWTGLVSGRSRDPFDTFDWIMDQSEKLGLVSSFNFMAGGETRFDRPGYSLRHPFVRDLIARIASRGHEIGFHPSYATVSDGARWRAELDTLRRHVPAGAVRGGRQHYLRFRAPETWRLWSAAGMEYDSTLVFADHAGFRCGVCHEFPVFDVLRREPLGLKERPTIVMESTVTSDRYMGLGTGTRAREYIEALKHRCRIFGGDFSVLWHNSAVDDSGCMELYRTALE